MELDKKRLKTKKDTLPLLLLKKKTEKHIKNTSKMETLHGAIKNIGEIQWLKMDVGITTMAIILSGYNKNYSPEDLRKKYYPVMNYDNFSKELNSFEIDNSDFYYDSTHLSNNNIINHLKTNRPIIICVWNKPSNNRWTTASHYMALLATSNNNLVYISNPNGGKKDSKSSGWYDINEVSPYIAKAIYITSYK